MNEVKRFQFEGHDLTFTSRDGEWWANGDEAADALGYEDKRQIGRLFRRHADEFLPSETCVVTLTPQVGQARETRLYSPKGLEHLAMLGRTETCKRFRRWVLDVMEQLRAAGPRLVTEEQMHAAILAAVETVAAQFRGIIAEQAATIRALSGAVATQASSAGKFLSYMSRNPEIRAALEEREDEVNGQTKFPWGGRLGGRLGGADGSVAPTSN